MEWLLALFSRVALLVVWFTTPLVNRAFDGYWIVPLLGVILLPLTTLTYIVVFTLVGSVAGLNWLWIAGALLLDLGVNSAPIRHGVQTSKRSDFPQGAQ